MQSLVTSQRFKLQRIVSYLRQSASSVNVLELKSVLGELADFKDTYWFFHAVAIDPHITEHIMQYVNPKTFASQGWSFKEPKACTTSHFPGGHRFTSRCN